MSIIGALIGGAVSLIGGRKQRKAQAAARADANYRNSPQGIRDNAEAAGFNPLVFAGPGTGTGAQYAPVFGNEYAQAGAMISDAFAQEEALKIQRSELELQNKRLEEIVKQTTLTPDIPGIYGSDRAYNSNTGGGFLRRGGVDGNPSAGLGHDDIPSILVPWRTENGEIVMLPNPDLPDADQYVPAIAGGSAGSIQSWLGIDTKVPSFSDLFQPLFGGSKAGGGSRPKARPIASPSVPFGPQWGNSPPRTISPTRSEIDSFRYRSNVLR